MAEECFNEQGQFGAWETCPGYVKPYECSKGQTNCRDQGKWEDYRVATNQTSLWTFAALVNFTLVYLPWWVTYVNRSWNLPITTNEDKAWSIAIVNSWLIWAPIFLFGSLAQLTGANFAYAVVMFYVNISWVSILLFIAALVYSYLSWDNTSVLTQS